MRFTKMQGLGNDYVYVSLFSETVRNPAELAVRISQPHYGVGADGLVLIGPSEKADFSMRIFNADGSESEMCGNAIRCIGKYVRERGLTDQDEITLETGGGICRLSLAMNGDKVDSVTVDMGKPVLDPAQIPVLSGSSTVKVAALAQTAFCVSMGNPHAVFFVDRPEAVPLSELGPAIEKDPVFPRRTNVEFVRADSSDHLTVRVWERGAGATLACGSGACAALVAAALTGRSGKQASVALPGGELQISWDADGHIRQTGPATFVFDGEWPD